MCLQAVAVGWHPFLLRQGLGEVHTYSANACLTQEHACAFTQVATKLHNLQILSIKTQKKQQKTPNENINKLCLRTYLMRWLVVLLYKHTQEESQLRASSYHCDY